MPMLPTDPATFVTDYEVLRTSFLTSRASPAIRLDIQRLIAQGLQAWLKRQPLIRPCKAQRGSPPCSTTITAEVPGNEALVQLIASMTQSLIFSEETA
jgi:hypothetical protein